MTAGALRSEVLTPGMRVGLFGGSFDPVHAGHLHVARTALKRLALDRVWWIVSPQNPLKPHAPGDLARRLRAVEAAARAPRMVVTDIEARLGVRYTADLVARLTAAHPGVRFVWIMGADSLAGFHRWKDWQTIAARVPIAVIARPTDPIRARLSRAARTLSRHRLPQSRAAALPSCLPPCWTYLTAPLHGESSRALRAHGARPASP
ncbi:nicotinate-nucleotide adenylyltransferase [Marinicauda algicola]|uniref:Probable nicotinate-nucleotide adenylyltransferase n=1 Tax=Marinicauda algicola TaxID=2029849 RepID=A0A4S2H0J0_9PROT|nr:nicotinate-nucleotide adenylyltransferase [Marinicauda algicola]TGY88818.1 nicotinate-nucleotide adenylyltransferase [Marinicauda algicola]